jgi:hypothetical protein
MSVLSWHSSFTHFYHWINVLFCVYYGNFAKQYCSVSYSYFHLYNSLLFRLIMPTKREEARKERKERYSRRTTTSVSPGHSNPNSPLQGSEEGKKPDMQSPSSALASMQIGTPRPRKESTSSEAPPTKKGRENSENSEFSTPNLRGRPLKR